MVSKACREEKTKLVSDRAIRDLTDQLGAMDIDHEGGMHFCRYSLVHIDMLYVHVFVYVIVLGLMLIQFIVWYHSSLKSQHKSY